VKIPEKTRPINEIIAHLRMACENPSVCTTLIQTCDLLALCDAVERADLVPVVDLAMVLNALKRANRFMRPPEYHGDELIYERRSLEYHDAGYELDKAIAHLKAAGVK